MACFGLGLSGAAIAADDSCLFNAASKHKLSGANIVDADPGKTVFARPCKGQVVADVVEVFFSTGDGPLQQVRVKTGQAIEKQILDQIGPGKKLVDVMQKRSMLAALMDLLNGRQISVAAVAGFEKDGQAFKLSGELLPQPGTRLHLKLFGLDPMAPVKLQQGGWSTTLTPVNGAVLLPVDKLTKGELSIVQGPRAWQLAVLDPTDAAPIMARLAAIRSDADSRAQALQRAYLLQEEQLFVNAVSAYMEGR